MLFLDRSSRIVFHPSSTGACIRIVHYPSSIPQRKGRLLFQQSEGCRLTLIGGMAIAFIVYL